METTDEIHSLIYIAMINLFPSPNIYNGSSGKVFQINLTNSSLCGRKNAIYIFFIMEL